MKRDCACKRVQHQHGTPAAYLSDRCRCFACRIAKASYVAGEPWQSTTMVPAVGVTRRLQALACLGWSPAELAAKLGHSAQFSVACWRKGSRAERVTLATHTKIAALYDELWDQPSTGRYRLRVIRQAERNGYVPPLMWDEEAIDSPEEFVHNITGKHDDETPDDIDEIAVERAMNGERIPLTRAELTRAIDTLTGMGYSADMTAARLGVSDRLVQRYRAKGRAA